MSKKQSWLLIMYTFVFLALIGVAIWLQSELYLYAASALPILIVMALPDIRQHQYIRGSKDLKAVRIHKQSDGESPLVIMSFPPGFVRWNCKKLFFHLNDIQANTGFTEKPSEQQASLSVLGFDLSVHPSKTGWIGIDLDQLALRTANLSYTTDEITRFVIPVQDLEEAAIQMMSSKTHSMGKSKSKSISA
ncbi:hypothetical protein [Paenibacillus piri]|uniref:Uncharacterized protein n=1 Tax=Paenibacillus piri TaxID=2547395 RepID=A0A4R5KM98_9BACL|nr:hypothetical protein [Paenibacillus piri]TDF96352.1 hypothetical protein E1757_18415 [Paenibacillus piri]